MILNRISGLRLSATSDTVYPYRPFRNGERVGGLDGTDCAEVLETG